MRLLALLHVSDFRIFGTLKDDSLEINSLDKQLFQLQKRLSNWHRPLFVKMVK